MDQSSLTYNGIGRQDQSEHSEGQLNSHEMFKEAVCWELANGRLSTWRRKRLVQYAAAFNISATDAGRLIQAATQLHGEPESPRATGADLRITQSTDDRWPTWAKLLGVFSLVVVLEFGLYWLIRA